MIGNARSWRRRIETMRARHLDDVAEIERVSQATFGQEFISLGETDQDRVLSMIEDPALAVEQEAEAANTVAGVELFCPVPRMVGGGTAQCTGWLPRMTENEFRPHTIWGDVDGATLADRPISYDDLEPYYTHVEWAFGVSGIGGVKWKCTGTS